MTSIADQRANEVAGCARDGIAATAAGGLVTIADQVVLGDDVPGDSPNGVVVTHRLLVGRRSLLDRTHTARHGLHAAVSPLATADSGEIEDASIETRWRDTFRYGALYFRRGPGLLLVKDSRDEYVARLRLDDPELVLLFERCLDPVPVAELDTREQEALEVLAGERLVAVYDGLAVTLPARLRRWPVPFTAV